MQHMNSLMHIQVLNARTKRKLELDGKKEQCAITMVVSNSLINFLLRFPEIFIFLCNDNFLYPNNVIFTFFDSIARLSDCLIDLSYLTYILTFSSNVLIYYLFNQKFKQAFSF
jgi:hypothetical protein